MHVINYEVHNVLKISDLTMDMEGRHLFLVGGENGQGKTSAINAFLMAICGASGMDYPKPALKEGESEGWVRVKLTGCPEIHEDKFITVELEFKRKRGGEVVESFRVLDSTGEEAPGPRGLLKRLYKNRAFDPLDFDRLDKKKRREVLMQLVGLDLEAFKSAYRSLYDQRSLVNREMERQKGKVEAMQVYPSAPLSEVVIEDVVLLMDQAKERNRAIQDAEKLVAQAAEAEVKAMARVVELEEMLVSAKAVANEASKCNSDAIVARKKLGDPIAIDEFNTRIKEASEINLQVAANKRVQTEAEYLKKIQSESDDLSQQLKDLERSQDEAMQKVAWPIPGLAVDDEGVLFDGLPYESASKSQRIRVSTRVGMALQPELKLLVCEDGNDLDLHTLQAIEAELVSGDFQMLVEFVTRGPSDEALCAVVIENGKEKPVKKAASKAVVDEPVVE